MLQGHPRGDPLSHLSLLFQVLYPVFAPRPTQTEPRPEGFVPGRQLARARWLFTSRSRSRAVSPQPRSYPCTSLDGSGGGPPTPQGRPRGTGVLSLLRPDSWPLSSRLGLSRARSRRRPPSWFLVVAGETRSFLPNRCSSFTGVFTALVRRISAQWIVSCRSFLGLGDAIISAGPLSGLRSVALGVQLHRLQATPPSSVP
ncbi:hypothetical protein NDU88_006285 [Pleurodeles waltl]|uniref:Uncharacterized protein n=1 Tax=Pleurodeles waltl TaxID=8319 RepID=A0AAV7RM27_PLEWA|nr:hypothetical protein NDU88_006285 [Pleurodeles waltl]